MEPALKLAIRNEVIEARILEPFEHNDSISIYICSFEPCSYLELKSAPNLLSRIKRERRKQIHEISKIHEMEPSINP